MQDILLRILDYNPLTGILVWRERPNARKFNARFAGKQAGTVDSEGYRKLEFTVDGVNYRMQATMVIWIMQTGAPPTHEIDHDNRRPDDNRWDNLREATRSEQTQNRVRRQTLAWPVGVQKRGKRFQAAIAIDKKWIYLGTFATPEAAHQAYLDARERLHPRRPK